MQYILIGLIALMAAVILYFTTVKVPTADQLLDHAVEIEYPEGGGWASGVLVGPDLVLTAKHVAEAGEGAVVKTRNGSYAEIKEAKVDDKYDVALLTLKTPIAKEWSNLNCRAVRTGEKLIAVGSPGALHFGIVPIVASGGVPEAGLGLEFPDLELAAGPFQHGLSGGAVYGANGQVLGIVAVMIKAKDLSGGPFTNVPISLPSGIGGFTPSYKLCERPIVKDLKREVFGRGLTWLL